MITLYIQLLLIVYTNLLGATASRICTTIDDCSCKFNDNGKIVSLRALDNADAPPARFKDVKQSASITFSFDYNPCTPFTMKTCKDQLVCQHDSAGLSTFSAGGPKTFTTGMTPEGKLFFHYTGTAQGGHTRSSKITLECEPKNEKPYITNPIEDDTQKGTLLYTFGLHSKCACEGACSSDASPADKKGISIGTVLCIILLVVVALYIAVGILYLKFYKKLEGLDVIPNREFWGDFPSKVTDGFAFTYSKMRSCKKSEYEEM